MSRVSLPSGTLQLAALEQKVSKGFGLEEVREMTDQICEAATIEKTKVIAESLLVQMQDKIDQLVDRNVILIEQDHNPISRIKTLQSLILFLAPSEISHHLEAIELDLSLSKSEIDAQAFATAKKTLGLLKFLQKYPQAGEFNPNGEFGRQMRKIAEQIEKTQSFNALSELNEVQRGEIGRALGETV
jgi:hypothetical protein